MTNAVALTAGLTFEVESNAQTMRLLADKVYRHKIPAAIREIIFNGYDAMVEAGTADQPLVVHLPSIAEPYFSVIDSGTGMSRDFIANGYRKYGYSTKGPGTAAKGQIGKLGLGSKAPLAVAERFQVISRHDGTKSFYEVFWGEDGKPHVRETAAAEKTDDRNGVEVTWAVKGLEIAAYRDEVAKLCTYFRPLPTITGLLTNDTFKPNVVDVAHQGEGDGYRFRKSERLYSFSEDYSRAVMGMIVYPIDVSVLKDLTEVQGKVIRLPLDIDFDLGALEFTPGREDLSYDDVTIPGIKSRLNKVAADMRKRVDARFVDCDTRYAALSLFRKLSRESNPIGHYVKTVAARWRKETITKGYFEITRKAFPNVTGKLVVVSDAANGHRSRARRTTTEWEAGENYNLNIPANDTLMVFVDDLKTGGKSRFMEQVRQHDYNENATLVYLSGPEDEVARLVANLDGVDILKLSDFVAPKAEKVKMSVKVLNDRWKGRINKDTVRDAEIDAANDEGYYMVTRMGDPDGIDAGVFAQRYDYLIEMGLFDPAQDLFVIVPATLAKSFVGRPNWTPMVDRLEELAAAELDKPGTLVTIAKAKLYDDTVSSYGGSAMGSVLSDFQILAGALPEDHAIAVLNARLTDYAESWQQGQKLAKLAAFFKRELDLPDLGQHPLEQWTAIKATYALLDGVLSTRPKIDWNVRGDEHKAHDKAVAAWQKGTLEYVQSLDATRDPNAPKAAPVTSERKALRAVGTPTKGRRSTGRERSRAVG